MSGLEQREQRPYEGLSFGSVQRVVREMVGREPRDWQEFYKFPGVVLEPNVDLMWLQKTGFIHYLWKNGWQNVDEAVLDIIPDGRVAPPFEDKVGHLAVFRHSESDQIVEVHLSYLMPDVNGKGFREKMSIDLERLPAEKNYRLTLRDVGEYRDPADILGEGAHQIFPASIGMVYTRGYEIGLDSDSPKWEEPRYATAFKGMVDLLGIKTPLA